MPGLYCVTRFFIEFVKEYQAQDPSFPLTMGQLLSIPVVVFCAGMIWWKKLYVLSSLEERVRLDAAASPQE
jgi:prolipoprotein diacylglyceryltransferase